MGVALDDIEPRGHRRLVERVGQLAQTAADVGNEAALAQLATFDKAAAPRRPADLTPEAEQSPGRNLDAVDDN